MILGCVKVVVVLLWISAILVGGAYTSSLQCHTANVGSQSKSQGDCQVKLRKERGEEGGTGVIGERVGLLW